MTMLTKLTQLFLSPQGNGFPVLIALIGFGMAYLGYDLFRLGVQEGGAALSVSFGAENSFEMGKGGPGLMFVAFGMGLIIYAIKNFQKLRVKPDSEGKIDGNG